MTDYCCGIYSIRQAVGRLVVRLLHISPRLGALVPGTGARVAKVCFVAGRCGDSHQQWQCSALQWVIPHVLVLLMFFKRLVLLHFGVWLMGTLD